MERPRGMPPVPTSDDHSDKMTSPRSRRWLLVGSAIALVVVLVLAGTVALKASKLGPFATSATPTPAPFITLEHLAQLNAEWLDPTSPFSQQAQQQLDAIGRHAGRSLAFQTSYDYIDSDTDGNPHVHQGYYVTLGAFELAGLDYVTVGAVTARSVRTPLTFSLANLPALHQVVQDWQGTYPSSGQPAAIAPAALLAFLGRPGRIVGLDLVTSAFIPNVAPIINALEGERTTSGLPAFQLPAPGQPLNPADYPLPITVYSFPPYSTPPGLTVAPTEAALPSLTPGTPTSAAATIAMGALNFAGATSVTIKAGQAVLFDDPVTGGGIHYLTTGTHGTFKAMVGAPSQFTPNGIQFGPGTSIIVVFPTAGTFTIICTIHPAMQATVTATS